MSPREFYQRHKHYIPLRIGSIVVTTTIAILIFADSGSVFTISLSLFVQYATLTFLYFYYRANIKRWTLDHNVLVKYAASTYPGVATVWLIFAKDDIYESINQGIFVMKHLRTFHAELSQHCTVDISAVYYVVSVLVWGHDL